MDIRGINLQVKANLKDKEDKTIDNRSLCLEFFDLTNNKWTTFLNELNTADGKLDKLLSLNTLEETNEAVFAMLSKTIEGNTLPSIRLVDRETVGQEWTVVFSMFPIIHFTGDVLIIDFGNLWLLDNPINRQIEERHPNIEFAIGAFPRPNEDHTLFSLLQFALVNAGYNSDEFKAQLVPIGENTELSKRVQELELLLKEKQNELENQLKKAEELNNRVEGLSQENNKLKEEIAKEEHDKETAGKIVEARPASDVYTTIVDEVKNASEKLEETPYTLANISLNLKTHVVTDADGFKLQLIDAETAKNTQEGTISEVKIDIGTNENQTKGENKSSTPNIIGLTETAARQRLKSFGLKMKTIYQTSKTKTVGQAFKQKPAPGDDINVGDTVITIFAKNSEKFN